MNIEQIKAAIRKALDERKEKTWFDFYGISYEDMYKFLGEDCVTLKKEEYYHLLRCKEELMRLYKVWPQSLRNTHLVKPDIPKEKRERMTEEERNAVPILGNMRPIQPQQGTVSGTMQSTDFVNEQGEADDLPF